MTYVPKVTTKSMARRTVIQIKPHRKIVTNALNNILILTPNSRLQPPRSLLCFAQVTPIHTCPIRMSAPVVLDLLVLTAH